MQSLVGAKVVQELVGIGREGTAGQARKCLGCDSFLPHWLLDGEFGKKSAQNSMDVKIELESVPLAAQRRAGHAAVSEGVKCSCPTISARFPTTQLIAIQHLGAWVQACPNLCTPACRHL